MKAIVYLISWMQDRPLPFLVECGPHETPGNCWQKEERHHLACRRYLGYIAAGGAIRNGIHKTINQRAELLLNAGPTGHNETGHRSVYPSFTMTDERIARSRFRKAKRDIRTGRKATYGALGYACIDLSFGLRKVGTCFDYTHQELQHIQDRLFLAARERGPLQPWHLSDCWPENRAA